VQSNSHLICHLLRRTQAAIIDVDNFTMSHFVSASSVLPKLIAQMQYGAPGREKGFFIINMASTINQLFAFMKSFLNEKMRNRVGKITH
jgi:CRAL/TRIO domain